MIDSEVEKITNNLHKLWAVDRVHEPLKSAERKLNAQPARSGRSRRGSEFSGDILFGIAS